MRFLTDEDVYPSIVGVLSNLGHDIFVKLAEEDIECNLAIIDKNKARVRRAIT